MNDPRAVALILSAIRMPRLRMFTSRRVARFLRIRRERQPLLFFHFFARLQQREHRSSASALFVVAILFAENLRTQSAPFLTCPDAEHEQIENREQRRDNGKPQACAPIHDEPEQM